MRNLSIRLDSIKPNIDNPNPHSDEKIATLAANIAEFGLIHPIMVKEVNVEGGKSKEYEIIAGHGRYRAFRELWKQAKSQKQTNQWSSIPCVVVYDTSEYKDWGRRLSENKLRSFNWAAEAIELAGMRGHGKTARELAELFGYQPNALNNMAALGFIPGLSKLFGKSEIYQNSDCLISSVEARQYILPLRVWPSSVPKNDKELDFTLYDYSECTKVIDLLVAGKLKREDLSTYSADRREAIAIRREENRVKDLAIAEIEALKSQAKEKDLLIQKERENLAKEIKKHQDIAEKKIERQRAEHQESIKKLTLEIKTKISEIQDGGAEKEELQQQLADLRGDREELEQKVKDLQSKIENMPILIRAEVEQKAREELTEQLSIEIQATKNAKAELEIAEARKLSAEEKTANDREKARLKKYHENLVKREEQIKAEIVRFQEEKAKEAQLLNIGGWIKEFNHRGEEFLHILEVANANNYWTMMEKPELKRILSVCSGVADQMRVVETSFKERGVIGANRPPKGVLMGKTNISWTETTWNPQTGCNVNESGMCKLLCAGVGTPNEGKPEREGCA